MNTENNKSTLTLEKLIINNSYATDVIEDNEAIASILDSLYTQPAINVFGGSEEKGSTELIDICLDTLGLSNTMRNELSVGEFICLFDAMMTDFMHDEDLNVNPDTTPRDKLSVPISIFTTLLQDSEKTVREVKNLWNIDIRQLYLFSIQRTPPNFRKHLIKNMPDFMYELSIHELSYGDVLEDLKRKSKYYWAPADCLEEYKEKMRRTYDLMYDLLYLPLLAANTCRLTVEEIADSYQVQSLTS